MKRYEHAVLMRPVSDEDLSEQGRAGFRLVAANEDALYFEREVAVSPKTVQLTYFKSTGKYYLEGTYETERTLHHEIIDEVREMHREGKLPGMSGQPKYTLVVPPGGVPRLIVDGV
jgi:hypothetical protein